MSYLLSTYSNLVNDIRLINIQLQQLLPIFEITDNMSDNSIFSAMEYIGHEVYQTYIQNVIDTHVSKDMFWREMESYMTKKETMEKYDEQLKVIDGLTFELQQKQQVIDTINQQLTDIK